MKTREQFTLTYNLNTVWNFFKQLGMESGNSYTWD